MERRRYHAAQRRVSPPALEGDLDPNSPIPLHHQLAEILRRAILKGGVGGESGKMPTELEIARRFGVSRITVRTALDTLVNQGLIWRRRGVGTFVRTNRVENWVGALMGFAETIRAAGFEPRGKVLRSGAVRRVPREAPQELAGGAWVFKRLRFADDQPIAIEESYFPLDVGQAIDQQPNLDNLLTYRFIENELRIRLTEARQRITAINANKTEARMLHIEERAALLHIERTTLSDDHRVIEYLRAKYRPDYFNYVIDLHRRMEP